MQIKGGRFYGTNDYQPPIRGREHILMIIACHTHFWRYPGELTEKLAHETFIMRRQKVELDRAYN